MPRKSKSTSESTSDENVSMKRLLEESDEEPPSKKQRVEISYNLRSRVNSVPSVPSTPPPSEESESSEQKTFEFDSAEESDTEESDDSEDEMKSLSSILERFKDVNPMAYKEYVQTLEYITKTRVNIVQVLLTPMRREDKALIVQMYDVLRSIPYPSHEYIEYHKLLVREISEAKRRYNDYCRLPEGSQQTYEETKEKLLTLSSSIPLDHQIVALDADDLTKSHILKEYLRMCNLSSGDDEKAKLEKWITTCLSLPFRRCKPLSDSRSTFLRKMKDSLDENIYGLEKVKEQLLIFANARISNPEMKECTLGLVGPPGIGKTMISRLISKCLDTPFAQISCGGITDPETLRGHSYTYVGSRPGEITNALIEMGYSNGVIFFDEFEKIAQNPTITSMLLHVLDPLQNSRYQDHYLGRDVSLNLSGVWFVLSMNGQPVDSALRDRIFTITLPGYTSKEKFHIAKKHLIPKHFANMKISPGDIIIPDETINHIISDVKYDVRQPGVRELNRILREVISKVHFLQQSDVKTSFTLSSEVVGKSYTVKPEDVDTLTASEGIDNPMYMSMYM